MGGKWDTLDFSNHAQICRFLQKQSDKITELECELSKHIGDGEWDIRDTTFCAGKFRLEEWGERYHQFYENDNELEDETVILRLLEHEKLKQFRDRVFELIDEKIERETYSAEMIEKTIDGEHNLAVNRLTIAALEELKKELDYDDEDI